MTRQGLPQPGRTSQQPVATQQAEDLLHNLRVLRGHVDQGISRDDVTELSVPQDKILVFRHNGSGITFEWV